MLKACIWIHHLCTALSVLNISQCDLKSLSLQCFHRGQGSSDLPDRQLYQPRSSFEAGAVHHFFKFVEIERNRIKNWNATFDIDMLIIQTHHSNTQHDHNHNHNNHDREHLTTTTIARLQKKTAANSKENNDHDHKKQNHNRTYSQLQPQSWMQLPVLRTSRRAGVLWGMCLRVPVRLPFSASVNLLLGWSSLI